MTKIELIGRVLFFGILAFGEIALAIAMHLATKISEMIKSRF